MSNDLGMGVAKLRLDAHRSPGAHPRAAWGNPERKQDIYSHFSLVVWFGLFFPFAEYFYSSWLVFAREGRLGSAICSY